MSLDSQQAIINHYSLSPGQKTEIACPVCCADRPKIKRLTLTASDDGNKLLATCHKSSCDFGEIATALCGRLGLAQGQKQPHVRKEKQVKPHVVSNDVDVVSNDAVDNSSFPNVVYSVNPEILAEYKAFQPYNGQACAYAKAKQFSDLDTKGLLYDGKHKSVIAPIKSLKTGCIIGYEWLNRGGDGGKGCAKGSSKNLGYFAVGGGGIRGGANIVVCEGVATSLAVDSLLSQSRDAGIVPQGSAMKYGKAADLSNVQVLCCFGESGVRSVAAALGGVGFDVFVYLDNDLEKNAEAHKKRFKAIMKLCEQGVIAGCTVPQEAGLDYWDVWRHGGTFSPPLIFNALKTIRDQPHIQKKLNIDAGIDFISHRDAIKMVIQYDKEASVFNDISDAQGKLVSECNDLLELPAEEEMKEIEAAFYGNRNKQLQTVNKYAFMLAEESIHEMYCVIADNGGVIHKTPRGFDALNTKKIAYSIDFLIDAKGVFGGVNIKYKPLHQAWRGWEGKIVHKRLVYIPGVTFSASKGDAYSLNDGDYNTFRGFAANPVKGDCEIIKSFVLEQICNKNQEQYDYLMNVIAQMIQQPGEKIGVNVVLPSGNKQGIGKGTLYRVIEQLLGRENCCFTSAKENVLGQFNSSIDNKLFVWMDETIITDSKHIEAFKSLTTELLFEINEKGVKATTKPSFHRVFAATDKMQGVKLTVGDRRTFVPDIALSELRSREYWKKLNAAIYNDSVINALMYELKSRDLDDVDFAVLPTMSKQQQASMSGEFAQRWVKDCVGVDSMVCGNIITSRDLKEFWGRYGKSANEKMSSSFSNCLNEWKQIFGEPQNNKVNGNQLKGYRIGTLAQAWQMVADYYGYSDMPNPHGAIVTAVTNNTPPKEPVTHETVDVGIGGCRPVSAKYQNQPNPRGMP